MKDHFKLMSHARAPSANLVSRIFPGVVHDGKSEIIRADHVYIPPGFKIAAMKIDTAQGWYLNEDKAEKVQPTLSRNRNGMQTVLA